MRILLAAITLLLSAAAHAEVCPLLEFEISKECIEHYGITDRLAFFESKIAEAKARYGITAPIRVHVFSSVTYSRFSGTSDEAFSWIETDNTLRPVQEDVYIKWTLLARQSDTILEHIAYHEPAHFLNGDISGFHPNGKNTETAAEHRVLEIVGEQRYREYIRAYFEEYRPKKIDYDRFVELVRATVPVPQ